ncbi:ATPase, F1/V1/A1 complex, alpha/beta subunit [Tanacetum coccineum]
MVIRPRPNVVSNDESFPVLNTTGNSSGGSPEVVKDGMGSGFVDPKVVERAKVKIPKASILDVHSKFGFSLYGYFVGKRVAFPVVENYIKNAWKKFGLVRVIMNSRGFFFFKFASIEGMNGVLENGPLFIRSASIILKKWIPNGNLVKEVLNPVSIWVKFHYIPIMAFIGRMDYARALIDIRVDRELKEDMVIVIPNVKDDAEVLHTVRVEYEWEPPRCGVCMVFGHDDMLCPKQPVEKPKKQHTNHDGFQYTSSSHGTNNSEMSKKVTSFNNPFDALNTIEERDKLGSNGGSSNSGKKVVQSVVGLALHIHLEGK